MSNYVHSYSGLKEYETCPRKFQATKILKLYPYKETEATRYGNEVHKSIEDHVNSGMAIPPKHAQFKPVVEAILNKPGEAKAELALGVTRTLAPCGFWDKGVWLRGKIDLTIRDDDALKAWVIDWKTGNNKYPDIDQLTLMSLLVFTHYSHIRQINSGLVFLLKNDLQKKTMLIEDMPKTWRLFVERFARVESAIAADNFPAKSGPLCGWCEHTPCEHHPKH